MGNLVLRKRKGTWLRSNSMEVKKMGIKKYIVLSSRIKITREVEKKPISLKRWRKLKRRSKGSLP